MWEFQKQSLRSKPFPLFSFCMFKTLLFALFFVKHCYKFLWFLSMVFVMSNLCQAHSHCFEIPVLLLFSLIKSWVLLYIASRGNNQYINLDVCSRTYSKSFNTASVYASLFRWSWLLESAIDDSSECFPNCMQSWKMHPNLCSDKRASSAAEWV